jgi:hypothetical protein
LLLGRGAVTWVGVDTEGFGVVASVNTSVARCWLLRERNTRPVVEVLSHVRAASPAPRTLHPRTLHPYTPV